MKHAAGSSRIGVLALVFVGLGLTLGTVIWCTSNAPSDTAPLAASGPNLLVDSRPITRAALVPGEPGPSGPIHGICVRAEGAPLAGVTASLRAAGAVLASTESGDDGGFALPLPSTVPKALSIEVHKPGWQKLTRTLDADAWSGGLDLGRVTLLPAATVVGTVRDAEGVGIDGATVYLPREGSPVEEPWRSGARFARADAQGRFAFADPVACGTWAIVLDRTGAERWSPDEVCIREPGEVQLDLLCGEREATISGRVLNHEFVPSWGNLIEPPSVEVRSMVTGAVVGSFTPDNDGEFHITRHGRDPEPLVVRFVDGTDTIDEREPVRWGTHGLELAPTRPSRLDVFVEDSMGTPVTGDVFVLVEFDAPRCEPESSLRVRLDEHGHGTISEFPSGRRRVAVCRNFPVECSRFEAIACVPDGAATVKLRLLPVARLEVRLQTANGRSSRDWTVELRGEATGLLLATDASSGNPMAGPAANWAEIRPLAFHLDAVAVFALAPKLEALPRFVLRASHPDGTVVERTVPSSTRLVELVEESPVDVDLVVPEALRSRCGEGVVSITLGPTDVVSRTPTGEGGRGAFRFPAVPAGEHSIWIVSPKGCKTRLGTLEVRDGRATVTWCDAQSLRPRVLLAPRGSSLENVVLVDPATQRRVASALVTGREARFPALAAGPYEWYEFDYEVRSEPRAPGRITIPELGNDPVRLAHRR